MAEKAVVLTGLKETLKALESFDKEAVRSFNKISFLFRHKSM